MTQKDFIGFYNSAKIFFDSSKQDENELTFCINGIYNLNVLNNKKLYQQSFKMLITVDKNQSANLPLVKLIGIKRSKRFQHIYNDETCCLGLNYEIKTIWKSENDGKTFCEQIIDPFLINYLDSLDSSVDKINDRPHAITGVLDYFSSKFTDPETSNIEALLCYVYKKVLRKEFSKGQNLCPCGSGLIIRRCKHSNDIKNFINELLENKWLREAFIKDMEVLINERKQN